MANILGRYGAPMQQPTKDTLRRQIGELRSALKAEQTVRKQLERKFRRFEKKLKQLLTDEGTIRTPRRKRLRRG
jgi:hypothetical protein